MTYQQPNRAPVDCREPRCDHLIELTCAGQHNDRCANQVPMHAQCAWHTKTATNYWLREKK